MENQYLHEVAITAIVIKDGKYLITRRSPNKKKFPGSWTVPGGRLEVSDYASLPKDTEHHWYNILEKTLRREVKEEVGIEIDNIDYLTSLTMLVGEHPAIVISCMADYTSGDIELQAEENDKYAWVSLEEAKEFDLIEGIYDELVMAENKAKGVKSEWQRF